MGPTDKHADTTTDPERRPDDHRDERPDQPEHGERTPPSARVREEDLEPHAGLRYIAGLFKALAILLLIMLIGEVVVGLRQDGTAALSTILVEATRIIVFAGLLWAAGDLAIMLIESNHDLRAVRILLGRLNGRLERVAGEQAGSGAPTQAPPPANPL